MPSFTEIETVINHRFICRVAFLVAMMLLFSSSTLAEHFVHSSHKLTSSVPIHLDLKRFGSGTNSSSVAADPKLRKTLTHGRTRPLFFQQALGLVSGKPFNFDLNRWRQVRDSDLFSDLSIVSFDTDDDTVALEIEGYERPSRHFTTGVNIPANLANPELEIGFSMEDRNFRGLGETVRLSVFEREMIELDTSVATTTGGSEAGGKNAKLPMLPPRLSFLWKESSIGKTSQLSVGFSEDHNFFKPLNLIPNCLQKKFEAAGGEHGESVQMHNQALTLNLDGVFDMSKWDKSRALRAIRSVTDSLNYRWSPFKREMTFRMGSEATSDSLADEVGARSSLYATLKNGVSMVGWFEGGFLSSNRRSKKYEFNQVGFDVASPEFAVFTPTTDKATVVATATKGKATEGAEQSTLRRLLGGLKRRLEVTGVVKTRLLRSWGAGCVPLQHHGCVGSAAYARAYFGDADTSFNHASALASVKTDLYMRKLVNFIKVGVFVDGAVFINAAEERKNLFEDGDEPVALHSASAVGVSLSALGLRVDCAFPTSFDHKAKLFLRLDE